MKKFFLSIAVIVFSLLTVKSQEISVKKGIVSFNDVPTLKMDGDCGIFKSLNYTFLSLNGDTLFTMKDNSTGFDDPRNSALFWHEFNISKLKTSFIVEKNATFVNDKQVAKFFFSLQPNFIKNGDIDTTLLSQFISKNDYTSVKNATEASILEFERKQKSAIDETVLSRDLSQPVYIKPLSSDKYNLVGFNRYTVYEIVQDKVLIGVIVVEDKSSLDSKIFNYYFLKSLRNPFEHNGKTHSFGLLAYVENNNTGFMKNIYIKELTSYSPNYNSTDKLMDYTKHLISIGCYK